MNSRSAVKPRKSPRQARARATVDAILDAAARILVTEGYGAASTNRVAEVAGVSIGSLYQYFPGKQSLIAALRRRHADEMRARIAALAGDVGRMPLREAVAAMVHAVMQAHRVDPALHRVFEREMPPSLDGREDHDREIRELLGTVLTGYRNEILPTDLGLASLVLMRTVDTLVHASLIDATPGIEPDAMEAEIVAVVLRYLLGSAATALRKQ